MATMPETPHENCKLGRQFDKNGRLIAEPAFRLIELIY